MLKKVKLLLKSLQYDPPEELPVPGNPPPPSEPLQLLQYLDARWRETDDEVSVTYREPPEEGASPDEPPVQVQLLFSKRDISTLSLSRGGAMGYMLVFCEGQRYTGELQLGGFCAEMSVVTRRLDNCLLTRGTLHLEYTLELQGCNNGVRIIDISLLSPDRPLVEYP